MNDQGKLNIYGYGDSSLNESVDILRRNNVSVVIREPFEHGEMIRVQNRINNSSASDKAKGKGKKVTSPSPASLTVNNYAPFPAGVLLGFHFPRPSMMLRRSKLRLAPNLRRLSSAVRRRIEDEGDWFYSSEWWGNNPDDGHTVFRSTSDKGNGVVSVVAYHSSRPRPDEMYWAETEKWLQQRYSEMYPSCEPDDYLRILGYQWRCLRFNDDTRQSTCKVMAAYRKSDPGSVFLMQQAHCLAVPYLKSMVSAGLASIASCNYDLNSAVYGRKTMKILCIGHGGGSLPLFLASKIPGANIQIVEIDPLVISASTKAMGFPSFSIMKSSRDRLHSNLRPTDEIMWKGIHERLHLHESDAEHFILESSDLYDMVFIDAYDGEDIFPNKLWDPHSPFLQALDKRLHPDHGTVVVNLHADTDISDNSFQSVLPMGKYVLRICKAYKDVLLGSDEQGSGMAFTVSVPWVCNASLVIARGFKNSGGVFDKDNAFNTLISKSLEVENDFNLPFSCLQYIKRGLVFC